MSKKRALLKSVLFLTVLAVVVYHLQVLFAYDDLYTYENRVGFQKEKEDRLDAVYIGGSSVYYFWQPLFGWRDHGIAVRNYCSNSMRAFTIKYFIEETRKKQPNALFIINITTFKKADETNNDEINIHRGVDYLPLSMNSLRLTHEMVERSGFKGFDRLEYYLPIIRFHSRWDSLKSYAFGVSKADYRSSLHDYSFLNIKTDVSASYSPTDKCRPLSDDMQNTVVDLLDYCDSNQLNVLFIYVPQATSSTKQGRLNTVRKMVEERGYPVFDLSDKVEELGIDLREEWWNETHTNIHGSLKISKAIGDYLVEHYHFEDKRGLPEWADWDASAEAYMEIVNEYTLPFECDHAQRLLTDIPKLSKPTAKRHSLKLKWKYTDDAQGFIIYRKSGSGDDPYWHEIGETNAEAREWRDDGLAASTSYTYTVVPFVTMAGERIYGSFNVTGITAKTEGES